ncbi:MAG: hypothetical protein ACYC26_15625 [Phycisphaerales bacterium]
MLQYYAKGYETAKQMIQDMKWNATPVVEGLKAVPDLCKDGNCSFAEDMVKSYVGGYFK